MNKDELRNSRRFWLASFIVICIFCGIVIFSYSQNYEKGFQDGQANCSMKDNNLLEVNAIADFQMLKVNCKEGSEFINNQTFLGCVKNE